MKHNNLTVGNWITFKQEKPKKIKQYLVIFQDCIIKYVYWNGNSFTRCDDWKPMYWCDVKKVEELIPFHKSTFSEIIYEQLEIREWDEKQFSVESGLNKFLVTELLQNKLLINQKIYDGLIKAFGHNKEYWQSLIKSSYWDDDYENLMPY